VASHSRDAAGGDGGAWGGRVEARHDRNAASASGKMGSPLVRTETAMPVAEAAQLDATVLLQTGVE
jgi:hypothetical protein